MLDDDEKTLVWGMLLLLLMLGRAKIRVPSGCDVPCRWYLFRGGAVEFGIPIRHYLANAPETVRNEPNDHNE